MKFKFPGCIIGFIAGTSLTWTSPEISLLNSTHTLENRELTDDESSWIGAVLSLSAAVGPFVFGYLADRVGRKYTLLAIAVPYAISSVITAFSNKVLSETIQIYNDFLVFQISGHRNYNSSIIDWTECWWNLYSVANVRR